jgi:hypothetical protein
LKFANAGAITLIAFGMIISSTFVNVYGQAVKSPFPQFPMIPPSNTSGTKVTTTKPSPSQSHTPSSASQSSSSISHGVRITSPSKGQQIPVGILTIKGTSRDNASSDCHVNIIVNGVKPYQNTSAAGHGGSNDYSNWTFTPSPKYTTIKAGANKITAKFSCNSNPTLASFYSVNVTGMPKTGAGQGVPSVTAADNSSKAANASIASTNQSR